MKMDECKKRKKSYKQLIGKVSEFMIYNNVSRCHSNQTVKKEFLLTPGQWELVQLALVRSLAIEELNIAELKKGLIHD